MNWKGIETKYKKALDKLVKSEFPDAKTIKTEYQSWICGIRIYTDKGSMVYYLRDLYDFFDKQGIYIQISVKCALDDSVWYLPYIWGEYIGEHLTDEDTRLRAEKAAFEKAFEILEKQL